MHTIEGHVEVGAVFGLGFEVEDGHLVEKFLHPIGRCHVHLLALLHGIQHKVCHDGEVFTGNPLVDVLTFYIYILIFDNVLTGAVVFLTLHHRHGMTEVFVLLRIGRAGIYVSVRQQTEKGVKFAPFSFRCFKCHNLNLY